MPYNLTGFLRALPLHRENRLSTNRSKRLNLLALGAVLLSSALVGSADAALPVAVDEEPLPSLAPMLERVTPAVVNISTVTEIKEETNPLLRDPFFRYFFDLPQNHRERKGQSLGSGVIVDAQKGLIITNHHVIDQAEREVIRLALEHTRGNRTMAAQELGISVRTLRNKLNLYADQGLEIPS